MNKINEKLKDNANDFELLLDKAFIFYREHDDNNTIDTFKKLINLYPNYIDSYFWLSYYLWREAVNPEEAIKVAKQGLKLDPNNAGLYAIIAWATEFMGGDEKEFVYCLKKSIELDPTWMSNRISLIYYFIENKCFDKAKDELSQAFKYAHDFPDPKNHIEQKYEVITRRDKSAIETLNEFKKIIEFSESNKS